MQYSLNGRLKIVAIALAMVLVLATVVVWSPWTRSDKEVSSDSLPYFIPTEEESGFLLISFAEESEDGKSTRIWPAVYNFTDQQPLYIPVDRLSETEEGLKNITYQHSFSNDGSRATFTAVTGLRPQSDSMMSLGDLTHQIYLADIDLAEKPNDIVTSLQNARRITNDETIKWFPVVSNRGDVLYAAHPKGPADTIFLETKPENWSIYLVSRDVDPRLLTNGTQPRWLTEDKFVYLKNDGVYLYDLNNGTEERVAEPYAEMNVQNRLAVSDDGSKIALSEPTVPTVRLFELRESAERPTLIENIVLREPAGSILFSPSGNLLVIQTAGQVDQDPNKRLNILSFFNFEKMIKEDKQVIFGGADLDTTFITDWVH